MNPFLRALVATCWLISVQAHAEVRETAANGFVVESSVVTSASSQAAYLALTGSLPQWWDPAHTWSGRSENLRLEPSAGGCFCETLSDGEVEHARVILARAGQMLRLQGALGPLQEMAVLGVLTFAVAPEGAGSRITLNYRVAGSLTSEAAKLAPLVDKVLGIQLARLGMFIDTGKPTAKQP